MTYMEVNFDGLIGPSHNYAGLALGNVASATNKGNASNPREAALQGLSKMRSVMELGLVQGFIPPQDRPALHVLHNLGFRGSDAEILTKAAAYDPGFLANIYSASSMWTANAATIAPSPDTPDGKVHFTPANLASHLHRTIEAETTAQILKHMFNNDKHFLHHPILTGGVHFGDEGAANHGRLCDEHGASGLHIFVYGVDGERYPARQAEGASRAVARGFGLDPSRTNFICQSRAALDAGAFHNDVVGVANENVLFLHEQSFEDQPEVLATLKAQMPNLQIVEAPAAQVSLADAIGTYLFNSQLLSLPGGEMALILPSESENHKGVSGYLASLTSMDNPITQIIYRDVRESMRNGGGPACLRLRVALSAEERAAVNPNFILDDGKIKKLEAWVSAHYRDRLAPDDLRDPQLAVECFGALDALTELLNMGSFYSFQK